MDIITHRGFTSVAPENTIPAFADALKRGLGIEADVRSTADNGFIISHDDNLERVTGVDRDVSNLTVEEIRELKIESRESDKAYRIPTLGDVLDTFIMEAHTDSHLALHLKGTNWEERITDLLDVLSEYAEQPDVDISEQIFVFDVTTDTAKRIKSINPDVHVGLSVGDADYFPRDEYPTIYRYEDVRDFDCWDIVWADEWRGSLYSTDFVSRVRADERTIICVSPELHAKTDPSHPKRGRPADVWRPLLDYGVDGICTDLPTELSKMKS